MTLLPRGIRSRAVLVAVAATLVIGAVLGTVSFALVTRVSDASVDELLDAQVSEVSSQFANPDIDPGSTVVLEAVESLRQVSVQVFDTSGRKLAESTGTPTGADLCSDDPSYLRRRVAVESSLGPLVVCAAASTSSVQRAQRDVLVAIAAVLPLTLAGVALAVWFAVGRALASVEGLRRQAEQMTSISDGALDVQRTGDEIERLGITMNGLLARLHAQSRATRQFVADAGHELRNPLATLRVALEFGAGDAPGDDGLPTLALAELDRLEGLVQDLLVLARTDAHDEPFHAAVEFDSIVRQSTMSQRSRRREVTIVEDLRPCTIIGDAQSVRSAVDNLIANAVRHADSRVTVALRPDDGTWTLTVDDDGRGLKPEDCARVFERLVRLDESRDRDEGGSGLGLAIVAAVAAAHHGSATASPGPGGHFALRLPSIR